MLPVGNCKLADCVLGIDTCKRDKADSVEIPSYIGRICKVYIAVKIDIDQTQISYHRRISCEFLQQYARFRVEHIDAFAVCASTCGGVGRCIGIEAIIETAAENYNRLGRGGVEPSL